MSGTWGNLFFASLALLAVTVSGLRVEGLRV